MPRSTWTQSNFNGGEWSPLAHGRFNLDKYRTALAKCRNFVPMQQGGLTRRPGTRYVALVKDSSYAPRLQRFEFSVTQAYVLEFGAGYIRFFTNDGQLLNGASAYEVSTPYSASEIWALNFAQSADTLYIAHPNHPVMKLQRAAATSWTLTAVSFMDGPYLKTNSTATTLTPSGTTGTVVVNASSTVGINGGAGFRASDVGRLLRIKCSGVWLWGTIASVTSPTRITWTVADPTGTLVKITASGVAALSGDHVGSITVTDGGSGYGVTPPKVTITPANGESVTEARAYATLTDGVVTSVTITCDGNDFNHTPSVVFSAPTDISPCTTTFWNLGLWNATDGYPSCVVFHQDRLCFGGNAQYPGRIDASNVADYENFAPSKPTGTVTDSHSYNFSLSSNTVNVLRWLVSNEWGLLGGTAGGEWVVSPSSVQTALTPSNVSAKQLSTFGTANIHPLVVGKSTLFVQRTGRKLREMLYQFTANTFVASDISLVGEHLTLGGIKQMALQLAPQQIAWLCMNLGTLAAVTYDKDQDICGWHAHPFGGYSDAARTLPALVESVASIPSPAVTRDEVWTVVNRYVNGATLRTIEVMSKFWEDGDDLADAVFLDASAEYRGTATSTISGLTWLIGETVGVLADGAAHPDCVVASDGTITLQRSASVVQVGLRYKSAGQTLRIESGGAEGPAQGKIKRIFRTVFRFFQSFGLKLGSDDPEATVYEEPFRTDTDPMDSEPVLFTGDKRWSYEGTWSPDGQINFEIDSPLPCTITLLVAQLDTEDCQ